MAQENNWLLVMMHKLRCVWSMYCDLKPNVFPSSPPYSLKDCSLTHSIGTYYFCWRANNAFFNFITIVVKFGNQAESFLVLDFPEHSVPLSWAELSVCDKKLSKFCIIS